jgi:hypothetical protein
MGLDAARVTADGMGDGARGGKEKQNGASSERFNNGRLEGVTILESSAKFF